MPLAHISPDKWWCLRDDWDCTTAQKSSLLTLHCRHSGYAFFVVVSTHSLTCINEAWLWHGKITHLCIMHTMVSYAYLGEKFRIIYIVSRAVIAGRVKYVMGVCFIRHVKYVTLTVFLMQLIVLVSKLRTLLSSFKQSVCLMHINRMCAGRPASCWVATAGRISITDHTRWFHWHYNVHDKRPAKWYHKLIPDKWYRKTSTSLCYQFSGSEITATRYKHRWWK